MAKRLKKYILHILRAHYQILPIIFLKEFIELYGNTKMMIQNIRLVELNVSIETIFLNIRT